MKAKAIFSLLFLGFFMTSMNAYEGSPKAISPGSEEGIAIIAQGCPTFSWAAVDWAESYRVAVFEIVGTEVLPYEGIQALSLPVISKEIRGRALSWTPSSNRRLVVGREYVWYVNAIDVYGQGVWSEGRMFKVDVGLRFDGVEENVRKKLQEQGVSDEAIEDVLADMKSGVRDVIAYGMDTQDLNDSADNRMRIQDLEGEGDYNTLFGKNAGASTTGLYNSFFGKDAGFANTTGEYNTFIGYNAGNSNIGGGSNTFMGYRAGNSSTGGFSNTFMGNRAGNLNTTGSSNTLIGRNAGYSNTTGDYNTFIGRDAGYSNTTSGNTFMGFNAGYSNTTGNFNTFIGLSAGSANITGEYNTFIGYNAGNSNIGGGSNTFMGYRAGYSNTTGYANTLIGRNAGYSNTDGHSNTFMGDYAGYANTTGEYNTFMGDYAGYSNTTGNFNTFIGLSAGYNNTGNSNTILGYNAGSSNTTGNSNTFIGYRAGNINTTGTGNVFLGYRAGYNETGSNKLYIENSDTSSPLIWGDFSSDIVAINGQLGVGTQSPGYPMELERTGTNASIIVDRTDGAMNYINATASFANFGSVRSHPLRLVVNGLWTLRLDSDGSLTMKNGATCTAGGEWQNASSRELKENIRDLTTEEAEEALEGLAPVRFNYKADKEDESIGFIAEDVPDLVATKDRKGMSTMDVVAVLTKVLQEQQRTVQEQQRKVEEQQNTIDELRERMAELEKK